jgi:imidazole glycerol-phosphate synthase subunit HisH
VIVIVDYGMGNLRSVQKAFERIGRTAEVSDKPEVVAAAERLVLPGVGAFGDAMTALRRRHLVEPLRAYCRGGRPFLGICLGLQILLDESEEVAAGGACAGGAAPAADETCAGGAAPAGCGAAPGGAGPVEKGLGIVPGRVVRFSPDLAARGLKVPHMGWNLVEPADRPVGVADSPLLYGVPKEGVYFYFAHSYYASPADAGAVAAETDCGGRFASSLRVGNVYATQFHPEKSQAAGLAMLENFVTRT